MQCKKSRTVNFGNWRPSVSSSLNAAGRGGMGGIHPLLLMDSDEDQKIKLYSIRATKKMERNRIIESNGVKRR